MSSETKMFKAIKDVAPNGSMKYVVTLLLGAAVTWGVMKTQVSTLNADSVQNKREHAEYREAIKDIGERLSRIEGRLEVVIPKK